MIANVLAVVANHGLKHNARLLRNVLAPYVDTIIVNSASEQSFDDADITISNTGYPGLWNQAVKTALEVGKEWLFFMASDVELLNPELLEPCLSEAVSSRTIQLWTPSVSLDSRCSFSSCLNQLTYSIRECGVVEGFCFLVRTDVLVELYPLPSWLKYGYGVDMITSILAHRKGLVVVDDRVIIFHPSSIHSHLIDIDHKGREFRLLKSKFQFSDNELSHIDRLESSIQSAASSTSSLDLVNSLVLSPSYLSADCPFLGDNSTRVTLSSDSYSIPDIISCLREFPDNAFAYLSILQLLPFLLDSSQLSSLETLLSECRRVLLPRGILLLLSSPILQMKSLWSACLDHPLPFPAFPDLLNCLSYLARSNASPNALFYTVGSKAVTDGHTLLFRSLQLPDADHAFLRAQLREPLLVSTFARRLCLNVSSYESWHLKYFSCRTSSLHHSSIYSSLSSFPSISVVMPVYNPSCDWLSEAIQSVLDQSYPHWELCIADDCSTNPDIRTLLDSYSSLDPRISIVYRGVNGNISACSNSALDLVSSPWLVLLDHDDLLTVDALLLVANAINEFPSARLFYSDEAKLFDDGSISDPYFKSSWNPFLMEGQNLICHLGVYQTELVKSLGGFRFGYEGSQDYDLALRYIDKIERSEIHHIPFVLYHWRVHESSTALSIDSKPWALLSAKRALLDHHARVGSSVSDVEITSYGYRSHFRLPASVPLVTIIIPTRNALDLLRTCVESILSLTVYPRYEILIIDNGSDDPDALSYLESLSNSRSACVLRDASPFNYSALINAGVASAAGDYLCLLNNDVAVIDGNWLSELVVQALRPCIGAVGARLLYPDRTIQHAGVVLGVGGVADHAHHGLPADAPGYFSRAQLVQEVSAVTGACLLVSRSNYVLAGGLDSSNLAVAFNDIDFCLRLRELGLYNVYTPYSVLIHHESATRGSDDSPEKKSRFAAEVAFMKERWSDFLAFDPYYSPNLSLTSSTTLFQLSWPPRGGLLCCG